FREKIKIAAKGEAKIASADGDAAHHADGARAREAAGDADGGDGGHGVSPLYILGGLALLGGGIAAAAGGGGGGGGSTPNVAPVATNDAVTTNEDTPVTFDVRANDSDGDRGTLAVTQINGTAITATSPVAVTGGSISLGADGRLTFTPSANFNGTPSFTYTLSDGQGGAATATVNLTVTGVNDAPVAANDAFTTAEDTAVEISVRGNDTDVDGDALTVTQVNGAAISTTAPVAVAGGVVSLNAAGNLVFTPTANFNGGPSFTYTVSDGRGGVSTATVNGTVTAVNDAPVNGLPASVAPVAQGASAAIPGLSVSDVDAGAGAITTQLSVANGVLAAGAIANGATISGNGTGSVTLTGTLAQVNASLAAISYTSAPGFSGAETLTITTSDGQATDRDTLAITVAQVTTGTVIDGYVAGARIFFDANDNGAYDEGEVVATTDANGRFVLVGEARGTMIAIGGVNTDTGLPNIIALKAPAGSTAVTPLTTLLAELVESGADLAGAQAQVLRAFGLPAGVDLTTFDFLAPGGDADLAFAVQKIATQIASVLIQATEAGVSSTAFGEQLAQRALGGDAIDLGNAAQLGALLTAAGVDPAGVEAVALKTAAINQAVAAATSPTDLVETFGRLNQPGAALPPVTAADSIVTDEDRAVTFDVRANDADPEGGALTVVKINGAAIAAGGVVAITGGTLTLGADGNLTFQPDANFNGAPAFGYTVADESGQQTDGTAEITVTPVNDAPAATADVVSFGLGVAGVVDVRANDGDVDGDALRVVAINGAAITADQPVAVANGIVSLGADGRLVFTPNAGFLGSESFSYTVGDDNGGFATSTVTAGLAGPVLPVAADQIGLAADRAGALAEAGVSTLDVAGDVASIGEAQAQALIAAGIDFAEADDITLTAEGTTLDTSLKALQALHVDAVAVGAGVAVLALDAGGSLASLSGGDLPRFNLAQADAALDVTLNVDGGALAPAFDLGGLAANLRAAGIDHVGVNGAGGLSLDVGQAQALAGAGLDFASQADITLDVDAAQVAGLDPALLAGLNVDHIDANGPVAISDAQAQALVAAGVDFVEADDVTVTAEGTEMSTSLKALQALHVDAVSVAAGVGVLSVFAGGGLEAVSAADLPSFATSQSDAALDVTLTVDGGSLDPALDLGGLAFSLRTAGIDHIGVAGGGGLGVSFVQAMDVSASGLDFTASDDVVVTLAANELALAADADGAAALGRANVDTLDMADDVASITDDQAANLIAAGLQFSDADLVTVETQGTEMSTTLRGLHDLKVDAIAVKPGLAALVVEAGDLTGLSAAELPQFDAIVADADLDVTLRVEAGELGELARLAQALRDAGIDRIVTDQDPATQDPAQAEALAAITRDFGIDIAYDGGQPADARSFAVQAEPDLLAELRSGYEGLDDDGTGGVYRIADGAHHALAESGLLRAYTADTLVIDGTGATSDKLLTTLKDIADMGIDEVRLADQGDAPVYIDLGLADEGESEIRALLRSLEHGQDGPDPIFQGAEKVALVLDADAAHALAQVDGAAEQLKAIGFTEIDVLADASGNAAPAFGDAGLEVKLIGQDDALFHHLQDR
ncbi:MAG: tandem-95 repeat protein, partial [Sphingomonas sp.]